MSRSRPILLVSNNTAKLAAWRNTLGSAGIDALAPLELSENLTLDDIHVILSDQPVDPQRLNLPVQRLERGEIGVVLIGQTAPADVQLPADATSREIVLACRLLGQIVAQRRQLLREQRQQRLLRQAAATDSLTGLANRRAWDEMWQQLQNTPAHIAAGNGHATVIALLDIDNFKRWNDDFGHALADQQLISVAERLSAAVRRGDFVFRWGGDEFALILSAVPSNRVAATVEQIRSAAGLNAPRSVTLSAGWAVLDQPQDDTQPAAFRNADEQLRRAKAAGGNQSWPTVE
ncbi:GGDEF domain-containing protein [Anatilimnocola floriformis]|uniref:GGDEF domain-containing protein n=1 Tax=Anatilimnocola floriformis TaxID=2948575 RepID=UPI0020C52ED6|nr:GGDEF domain-containing protein [Anatilimnocola floriformis]